MAVRGARSTTKTTTASKRTVKKAAPARKAAPAKKTVAKKATPARKAVPVKKVAPARKAVPVKKVVPARKAAPVKKAAPARKAAPAKKTVAKKATPARKTAVAKKAAPARKAAPAKKTVAKKATPARRAVPVKKAAPARKATAKRVPRPKPTVNDKQQAKYSPLFNGDPKLTQRWIDFKMHESKQAREELIVHYVSLVRYAVSRMNLALPSSLDRHDLYGYGIIGLMDAMEKFDLNRGLKFETYAVTRIKGAILDELRTLDWVPRSVRTKIRSVERASTELEHELGRTPTDDEIAERAGMTAYDVRSVMTIYANTYVGTLDEQSHGSSGEQGAEDTKATRLVDKSDLLPGEAFEESETRYEVADHIRSLDERERAVVALYYFEGLTLAEVGKVLGVTESRVCQIHTKALNSLRSDKKLQAAGL